MKQAPATVVVFGFDHICTLGVFLWIPHCAGDLVLMPLQLALAQEAALGNRPVGSVDPGSSNKLQLMGRTIPGTHCPWLCYMHFPNQPCLWNLTLLKKWISYFWMLKVISFIRAMIFYLQSNNTFWRESWGRTAQDFFCCPAMTLKHSRDFPRCPSTSMYCQKNKPNLAQLAIKIRS